MHISGSIRKLAGILLVLTAMFTGCIATSQDPQPELALESSIDTIAEPITEKLLYGIDTDLYEIEEGRVRRNDNLGAIFKRLDIPPRQLQSIMDNSKGVFDFRKIKRGNTYMVFRDSDSLNTVRFFVYIENPIQYYVFELGDNPRILPGKNNTLSKLLMASGTIEYSLWQTIIDQDLNPNLANELSEIFAWSIDFFGLQKGDAFKVIYEEQYVDTLSIGITRILAAWFFHSGEEFYAIPLKQNGREDYFDQDGNNLRKAFLKAPLRFSRISSGFSHNRMHPILKIRRPHHGVDYAAPLGTPVQAIGDGVVVEASYQGQAGRMVKIKHNSVYTTAYLHLSGYGSGIKVGQYVKQGDIIGYVGSTGLSTGPHLDFRFYKNGRAVNPLSVEAPPVEPLLEERKPVFEKVKFVIINLLQTIE